MANLGEIDKITLPSGDYVSIKDTTYESKTAASGGTDVSLVTTGEKYSWNNKVPTVSSSDNGKALRVVSGAWSAADYIAEYTDYSLFPLTGADQTLYIDTTTDAVYRWNGTSYVQLNGGTTPASITNSQIDQLFT